jgi:PAS domain S-box-containing protein
MKDDNKTKKQLIHELTELRSQNAELEKSTTGIILVELAAEEARRYAESIVETLREPLLVLDADLKVISANRSFYRTFKVTPGETIGSFIYDLGNKQWDIPKLRELLEVVLPEKEVFDDFEVEHHFQDIGHKIMLLNARQIYRKDIGAKMILLAIEDITEQKRLESLLIDSEEQYRRLFETASDGIVLLEKREGKITQANPATEKLLGYTEKESIGNSLQDIGVVLDTNDFQSTMQNLNKSGIINYRNVKVETKSGQHIDTEIYLVDRAKLVQCNIRDITERRRRDKEIKTLTDAMEAAIDGIALLNGQEEYIYMNQAHARIYGYEHAGELTGKSWRTLYDAYEIKRFDTEIMPKFGQEGSWQGEVLGMKKDGSNFPQALSLTALHGGGLICVVRDISERWLAKEELQASKAQLSNALEMARLGHWEYNIADDLFTFNDQFYNIFRTTVEKVGGYTMHSAEYAHRFIHPDDMDMVGDETRKAIETKDPDFSREVEHRMLYADGTVGHINVRFFIIKDAQGRTIKTYGVNQDITDRKRAEEELQRTLENLRKAFIASIQLLVSAVEARDPYTAGHQIRSTNLARAIATEMGLPQEKIEGLRMAGSIHDIGKLSIPAEILSKPTKLTNVEFSLIKEHARAGYEMLKDVESPWPLAEIVHQHHERIDGSGYPRQLKGDEILIEARIMAVADVVESMASHRPYRPAIGIEAALEEIKKNKGILYDDAVADACLRLFREKGFKL